MKEYKFVVTEEARKDLRRHLGYIKRKFGNDQAIRNIRDDFRETVNSLRTVADALPKPENAELQRRGLKRINFQKHDPELFTDIHQHEKSLLNC